MKNSVRTFININYMKKKYYIRNIIFLILKDNKK